MKRSASSLDIDTCDEPNNPNYSSEDGTQEVDKVSHMVDKKSYKVSNDVMYIPVNFFGETVYTIRTFQQDGDSNPQINRNTIEHVYNIILSICVPDYKSNKNLKYKYEKIINQNIVCALMFDNKVHNIFPMVQFTFNTIKQFVHSISDLLRAKRMKSAYVSIDFLLSHLNFKKMQPFDYKCIAPKVVGGQSSKPCPPQYYYGGYAEYTTFGLVDFGMLCDKGNYTRNTIKIRKDDQCFSDRFVAATQDAISYNYRSLESKEKPKILDKDRVVRVITGKPSYSFDYFGVVKNSRGVFDTKVCWNMNTTPINSKQTTSQIFSNISNAHDCQGFFDMFSTLVDEPPGMVDSNENIKKEYGIRAEKGNHVQELAAEINTDLKLREIMYGVREESLSEFLEWDATRKTPFTIDYQKSEEKRIYDDLTTIKLKIEDAKRLSASADSKTEEERLNSKSKAQDIFNLRMQKFTELSRMIAFLNLRGKIGTNQFLAHISLKIRAYSVFTDSLDDCTSGVRTAWNIDEDAEEDENESKTCDDEDATILKVNLDAKKINIIQFDMQE